MNFIKQAIICAVAEFAAIHCANAYGNFPYSSADNNFPRPLPLRTVKIQHTLNARDFGAIPDDGKCDRAALQKAINAASKQSGTALILEKGVYELADFPDGERNNAGLSINGTHDFELQGNGAKLLMRKPLNHFIKAANCTNTIIKDLTLDDSPRPTTLGKVIGKGKIDDVHYIDVEIFDGYLPPDDPLFLSTLKSGFSYFLDPKNPPRHAAGTYGDYTIRKVEKRGEKKFRIYIRNRGDDGMAPVKVGMLWRNSARTGCTAVAVFASKDFTCQNIVINASTASGFSGGGNTNQNFLSCRIEPAHGAIYSTNSDGIHISNNVNGVWIENCHIEGVGDDTMNFYKPGIFLYERLSARAFKAASKVFKSSPPQRFPADLFPIGWDVVFFTGGDGKIIFRAKVAKFERKDCVITFDRDIPEIPLGFDKMLSTTIYAPARGSGTVILNSTFKDNFRYGLFLKTSDVLIENCKWSNQSSNAIAAFNEAGWPEGFLAENVVVRNCKFSDCGYYADYEKSPKAATITFACEHQKDGAPQRKNILLENNEIDGWNVAAIRILKAENAVLKNNKIGNPSPRSPKTEPAIIVEE